MTRSALGLSARLSAIVVVSLCTVSSAAAETINLTFTSNGTPVTYNPNGGAATTVGGGVFGWKQGTPLNANFNTAVNTYCAELNQGISLNQTYTFTVERNLAAAPTVGTAAKAAAITSLFDRFYNTSLTSAANQSAFQLALWELTVDGVANYSLSQGQIRASNTTAQSWLDAVRNNTAYTNRDLAGKSLVALVSATNQDQFTVVNNPTPQPAIPAPPAVILAGIGLVGLAGRARFLRRAA
ncbi:MAG: Cys-Gln thioester bond-forming surface protein [Gemmataceae bacterium]|nr:Cys-Gln thioester bond-forming surface protein [Gemmataceae bacterium]